MDNSFEHSEPLDKNRKLIYAVKKAGIETYHPLGNWNGYGYEVYPLEAIIKDEEEQKLFDSIKNSVEEYQKNHPKIEKTKEEIVKTWARRLVKLYNSMLSDDDKDKALTQEEAEKIGWAKLDYKDKEIDKLECRNYERGYSIKRDKLIAKKRRENPLRYIKDESHALRIVKAHERHTHGYDADLQEAHGLEDFGLIEKGTARDVARKMYYGDWSL